MEGENEKEDSVKDLIKKLKEVNFPFEYYIYKGIGHCYPEDIDEKVNKAIKFILK